MASGQGGRAGGDSGSHQGHRQGEAEAQPSLAPGQRVENLLDSGPCFSLPARPAEAALTSPTENTRPGPCILICSVPCFTCEGGAAPDGGSTDTVWRRALRAC